MFKRRHRISSTAFLLILLTISIGMIYYYVDANMRPSLRAIAESRVNLLVNDTVSEAVQNKVVEEKICYQDLINIRQDKQGKIVMMQANTVKINQISTDITMQVDRGLRQLSEQDIKIPLGQVLGNHLFSDFGPCVDISVLPVGSVSVLVSDQFDSTGINQTRHQINLDIKTRVKIAVPFYAENIDVHTVVPITESIIVGDVPDTWVSVPNGLLGNIGTGK